MTTEQRQVEIAKCINAVARYYGVSASMVYGSRYAKDQLCHKARVVVWHHLNECGMTYYHIAAEFKMTYNNVQKHVKKGRYRLTEEDLMLIKTLPLIETTLDISNL